jgi:hypothetical protein
MANAFIKPDVVIQTVLGMLQQELVLPQLVWKDGLGDFSGKYNDTITIRIPVPTIAHTRKLRATGADRLLVASDLTETSVDVKLTDVIYNLINLTDEERELDLRSFGIDVLPRQVRAVSEKLEYGISQTIQNAPYQFVNSIEADGMWGGVVNLRRKLNDAKVPRDGRILIVGSAIEEALLNDERFIRYDSAGDDAVSRLQTARFGQLAQQQVIVVDTIPAGVGYLFHPTAFVMVTRAPGRPFSNNVAVAATGSENGVGLRWLGDYDSSVTTDRSLVDTWAGFKAVVDPEPGFVRAARIQLKATDATVGNADVAFTAAAGPLHAAQLTLEDNNGDDRAADTGLVTWTSATPAKATVSATGVVTAVSAGTSVITATVDGLTKTATVTVT